MAGPAVTAKGDARQADQLATPRPLQVINLHAFQQASFDPADYLNNTLPTLSRSQTLPSRSSSSSAAAAAAAATAAAVPLSELASQTQALLAQLNAQTSRVSITLTQLTDEILRTGSRLAYEVEVLRGDTIGLSDALEETLRADVARFLPASAKSVESRDGDDDRPRQSVAESSNGSTNDAVAAAAAATARLPPHMAQLKTLTLVRERLDSVIKVFGDAMQWVLPPSELSIASSLISVSTPDQNADEADRERKGREFAGSIRSEIEELVAGRNATRATGLDNAMDRIEALRVLAQVWKGTAEEKARLKIIDGLVRFAEEKNRSL